MYFSIIEKMSAEFSEFIDTIIHQLERFKEQIKEPENDIQLINFLRERERLFTSMLLNHRGEKTTRLLKINHLASLIHCLLFMYDNNSIDCEDMLNFIKLTD